MKLKEKERPAGNTLGIQFKISNKMSQVTNMAIKKKKTKVRHSQEEGGENKGKGLLSTGKKGEK